MNLRINMSAITGAGATMASIQHVTFSIDNNQIVGTGTAASAVDTSKSIIISGGMNCLNLSLSILYATLELTGPTTITATRVGSNASGSVLYGGVMLVEFSKGVNSLQRGVVTLPADPLDTGTQDVDTTITSVDISKCIVTMTYRTPHSSTIYGSPYLYLVNSTTIRARRRQKRRNLQIFAAYEVIEFE